MKLGLNKNYKHHLDIEEDVLSFIEDQNRELTILDLGCGVGKLSRTLSRMGHRVIGLDGDKGLIEKAIGKGGNVVYHHSFVSRDLPFDSESFDLVISRSFMQYVEHKSVINECNRILKDEGIVIFIENLQGNPFTGLSRLILRITAHQYQSVPWNHFTYREFEELRDTFENRRSSYHYFISTVSLLSVLSPLYGFLKSIDEKLIRNFSLFRKMAWIGVFIGTKK